MVRKALPLLGIAVFGCAAGALDEYWLKYSKSPNWGAKTRLVVVLPPQGYFQYPDLPKWPYGRLWSYLMDKAEATKGLNLATRDTAKVKEVLGELSAGWELNPDPSTAREVARKFGADAALFVSIESIRTGHERNDPAEPMYYEVVMTMKIYDTGGELLYTARARGKATEDLVGALTHAVDNAFRGLE